MIAQFTTLGGVIMDNMFMTIAMILAVAAILMAVVAVAVVVCVTVTHRPKPTSPVNQHADDPIPEVYSSTYDQDKT